MFLVKFWRRLRLQAKVIGTTLFLLGVMVSLSGWYTIQSERALLMEQIRAQGNSLANIASVFSIEPLLSWDYPVLETYAEKLAQEKYNVAFVRIEDEAGAVVVQAPESMNQNSFPPGSISLFTADVRVDSSDSSIIGKIVVGMINSRSEELIASRVVIISLSTLSVFLILALSMMFLLRKTVIKPIQTLVNFAEAFGKDTQDILIELPNDDEFGQLAKRLEFGRQSLKDSIKFREEKFMAEAASQAKSSFLANMSHEVRTPMNAVIGLSDLALQIDSSPQMQDYLTKISNSSKSLLRVINDILDFSKIEAGKLDLENTDFYLREIFENLSGMFRFQTTKKHVELVMSVSEVCRHELHGDPLRLEQILLNLIGNAIKFTDEGEIEIQVKTNQEASDQVTLEFSIRDTGIGMTEDQAGKLFQAFSQADSSTTRKFGGTGLGLSISKRLVEMMQGQLWVDSKPGEGSTFYFTAVFKRNLGMEEVDMIPPEELEHLRTLIVDDNDTARNSLQKTVNMFNFLSSGVGSGAEALQAVKQGIDEGNPYQLLIVDWFMPNLDGIKTIQRIKETILEKQLPKMLLMTPFDRKADLLRQGALVGVDGAISKPVNCSFLFNAIMDIFGKEVTKAFRLKEEVIDPKQIIEKIGGAKVLLVEDNTINQQVAQEVLAGVGLVVDIAEDGLEAIAKVKESTYDLVLMDIQMPNLDGIQATKQIRREAKYRKLPILAMTAHAMIGDREKSLEAGMNDHVVKPIDRKKLYGALMEWIQPREGLGVNAPSENKTRPKGATPGIPETLSGVDIKLALERLNGSHRLLRSLLFEFHRDHAKTAQMIGSALAGKRLDDKSSAGRLLHTVKGVSGNISATRLYKASATLEKKLKQPSEERSLALDEFEAALNEVIDSISTLKQQDEQCSPTQMESNIDKDSPSLDMEKITPLIRKLSGQIESMEYEAEDSFYNLKSFLSGSSVEVKMALGILEEQIDVLDLERAKISLSTLEKILGIDAVGDVS